MLQTMPVGRASQLPSALTFSVEACMMFGSSTLPLNLCTWLLGSTTAITSTSRVFRLSVLVVAHLDETRFCSSEENMELPV